MKELAKSHLLILSEQFPLNGGEPVMFDEIKVVAGAYEKVEILPLYTIGNPSVVPPNCSVIRENFDSVRLRTFLAEYGGRILKLFFSELLISPKRWWYIRNLRFVIHTVLGWKSLVYRIESAKKRFPVNTTIYSFWFNDWMNACYLANAQKHFKITTRILGYDFDKRQSANNFILFRETLVNYPAVIMGNSEYARNYYREHHSRAWSKVKVRKLGIQKHEHFSPFQNNQFVFVSASAAIPLKRVHLIIQLLAGFKSPFHWYFFGDGPQLNELKLQATELLPSGSFTCMGYRPREEIYKLYSQQHVTAFLHTSELESLPACLFEAASYGIPLIACDTCGVGEIANENTGLLLPVDFIPARWSARIESFCNEKGMNPEFRKRVKEYCFTHFDIEKNAHKTLQVLQSFYAENRREEVRSEKIIVND